MNLKTINKIGIINSGSFKGQVCLILYQCDYINTDSLVWFKIFINDNILCMSNNNVSFL